MNLAHVHLLLNHMPVVGSIIGLLLLLWAFLRGSDELKRASLALFVAAAVVSVPVFLTGEPAEELTENLPGVSEAVIERHEDSAVLSLIAAEVLGAISLFGLILAWRSREKAARWTMALSLAASLVTVGLMAWTANLGGQIRHTEIRASAAGQNLLERGAEADRGREREEDH